MKILILIILLWSFGLSSPAFSAAPKLNVDLAKEHGPTLSKASFHLRFQFEKTTGVKWFSSKYRQRKAFLENYYIQKAAAEKKEADENKRKARAERDQERQNRNKNRAEVSKARAEAYQARAEAKADAAEKKAFENDVKARQKSIINLRKNNR